MPLFLLFPTAMVCKWRGISLGGPFFVAPPFLTASAGVASAMGTLELRKQRSYLNIVDTAEEEVLAGLGKRRLHGCAHDRQTTPSRLYLFFYFILASGRTNCTALS